jgi:hypothetical protein
VVVIGRRLSYEGRLFYCYFSIFSDIITLM